MYVCTYPIARWANPATVPGMRAAGSVYEGLKPYINLLEVLESCKVSRWKVCGLSVQCLIAAPSNLNLWYQLEILGRILSPQCERGKICPFLFSKACGCVSVVLFFPLLGFSFSGCVQTESGKLQFSSQDEKYVGRICWSRGGANLIIPFLWGTSAGVVSQ